MSQLINNDYTNGVYKMSMQPSRYFITLRLNSFSDQRLKHYITELVNVGSQREFRVRGHAYTIPKHTVPGLITS